MLDAGAKVIDLSGAFRLRTPSAIDNGIRRRTPSRRCWPRRSTDCRSFAATASPARLGVEPGLLSDGRESRDPAAGRGRRDRPRGRHRLRRQIGRQRRGAQASAQDQLLRGDGELLGLFGAEPPARPGSAADLGAGGSASSASPRNCCRSTAAFSKPSISGPSDREAPRTCSPSTSSATRPSRSSGSTRPGTFPICAAVARTNFCDIGVAFDAATGRGSGGERHRQPGERRGRAGRSEYEPDARDCPKPRGCCEAPGQDRRHAARQRGFARQRWRGRSPRLVRGGPPSASWSTAAASR